MPHVHQLRRRDTEPFLPSELHVLERIKGCKSTSSCENSSVTCTYGIEDPSDAFWLRDYNSGIKFVVLFKIGIATLAFFVAAILSDGSIFYPHRVGVSILSGSVLIMVALSAFLYILLVPRTSQLSLYGGGAWQSLGFIVIVITIAALLPGLAVIWVNICVFCVFFVGFFLEQLVYAGIGILHFLGVLTLYQAENTLLHLRLIYFRDIVEDAEFDRQLVIMSTRFLRRVRGNWYLRRVPRALEEDALQFVENLLPDHLYEELMPEDAENIPEVDFDDIHESRENETAREPNNVAEERIPLLRRSVTT